LPAPTLPAPTLPAPTLPAPTLPAPTLPAPTLPAPTLPAPAVRRDLAGIGCRTDGGYRRARTACTGRRDRVRPAAPRAGIMGQGLPSRTTTRTAGVSQARCHRAARLPAARVREALVREALVREALVREALVREALVREAALQGPARVGRARVRCTGGRRRTAVPVRPGSPGPRGQAGQAGLRRCVSTRRLGRASRRRPDVTGPASRWSHRAR